MTPSAPESRGLLRGTAIVSLLTQLSRVLGFVREILTARLLGSGFFSDAYFVAFRIPNLLRSLVAEGALTSAFVPLFASELEKGQEEARHALKVTTGFLVLLTSALALLGIYFAPEIVHLFAPGFEDEKLAYCTTLTRIMLPYIVLVSLVSMMNGALNSVRVFGTAAWAQVVMNIALICGAFLAFFTPQNSIGEILAWSVIVGGICGVASQAPALARVGFTLRPLFAPRSPHIRNLLLLMIPALFGAAVYQFNIFISTVFASLLEEGAVSWIYYADRIAQLPIGVFTVALGSVLLPTLSRAHARGDAGEFTRGLNDSLRYTSFLMVPIAFVLYYLAEPLIILLLEGGKFDRAASLASAHALQAFSIGLWSVSCHSIAMKAFLARRDTITPSLLGVLSLITGVLFSLLLMGAPHSVNSEISRGIVESTQRALFSFLPHTDLGHAGLALSSSLSSLTAFLTLALLITIRISDFSWKPFLISTTKSLVLVAITGGTLQLIDFSALSPLLQITFGGTATVLLFLVVGLLLKMEELSFVLSLFRKITRRGSLNKKA